MIIAVDFDGTLVEDKFPAIGDPNLKVVGWVKEQQQAGAEIILWTCREGPTLLDAIQWCVENNIQLSAINDNVPSIKFTCCTGRQKIVADIYLDDKAVNIKDIDSL